MMKEIYYNKLVKLGLIYSNFTSFYIYFADTFSHSTS